MENTLISTEAIMAQIKDEIKQKKLCGDMPDFESVPFDEPVRVARNSTSLEDADEALKFMNAHYYVQPYKPLLGGKAAVMVKKVIRKMTKFYVEPIVFEQNDFNARTVSVLNSIRGFLGKNDIRSFEKRIAELEKSHSELLARIEQLERENSELKSRSGKKGRK